MSADMLLLSSAIFDSVQDRPFAGGVAVKDGRIEFVGSRRAAENYAGPDTAVYELGDRLVMPGFFDAHAHTDGTANGLFADIVNGLDAYDTVEGCLGAIRDYAEAHPTGRIYGINWALDGHPNKHMLDRDFPDRPVYLRSVDGHSIWMNSKAIEECRLEDMIGADPSLYKLADRDENGELLGYVSEQLSGQVHDVAEYYTQSQRAHHQNQFIDALASFGITSFTDATIMPHEQLAAYYMHIRALENSGSLKARFFMWPGIIPTDPSGDLAYTEGYLPYRELYCSDMLRLAGIKTIADGVTASYTSALLDDYEGRPGFKGRCFSPDEVYREWITGVNAMGFAVKVHCCGDKGVQMSLDSFEASNAVNDNSAIRNSIEHLELISPEDIPRFARLGVIACIQPAHPMLCRGTMDKLIGGERAARTWEFRKLVDSGAHISIGTDSPVVDLNPYHTVYKAVTRLDLGGENYSPATAGQALTLAETLRGYTLGAAYSNNMEHKLGTLEPGKYADICVCSENLFAIPERDIKDCRTVLTVMNGRVVYSDI